MNRNDLIVRLSASVLILGLISCSKEEKQPKRDVYKAEPPVIVQKEGNVQLKEWNLLNEKKLDLQDSFDVTASQPVRMDITTSCRLKEQNFTKSFSFAPVRPVKIFQLLPPEVLVKSIEGLDCAFELSLYNSVGSRHIFPVNTVRIEEKQRSPVTFQVPGEDQNLKRFTPAIFEEIKIRYRNYQNATAELVCEEFHPPGLRFDQVKEFHDFDFSEIQQKSLQLCRVMISSGGAIEQISRLVEVQMPLPPLKVDVQALGYSQYENTPAYKGFVHSLPFTSRSAAHVRRFPMGQVSIHNPASIPRSIRILKKGLTVNIEVQHGPNRGPNNYRANLPDEVSTRSPQWLEPSIANLSGGEVIDEGASWRVEISPNAILTLSLEYAPRPWVCHRHGPNGFRITTMENLKVEELSDVGEVLEGIDVPLALRLYWSLLPEVSFADLKRVNAACGF